jgi:EAL domain-containing protein (putative c-di-GMP-specific phosphodiesterase class I)
VGKLRSGADEQIADLLRTATSALGLSVAFLTRMDEATQHIEVVESSIPLPFKEGHTAPRQSTFCQAILDGRLPAVMPDVTSFPAAMELPVAQLGVRSFISVPVRLSDGTLYGTFCAASPVADAGLTQRDTSLMEVLAHAASVIIEPEVRMRARRAEIEGRLHPVIDAGGPVVALQPIIDLATGARVGAEALSRFPAGWQKAPDVCFAEAHSVGLGDRLEVLALERAAEHLNRVSGYIAMNVSPAVLMTPECVELLGRLPLDRVVLELSEHDPVEDYETLTTVLAPLRARGLRLAIDDVGAGFSSLRHIVLTTPEVIKLDRSLVAGVSADPVLTVLVRSMVDFAHGCHARVVAEGVETVEDAATLLSLGVDYGQGWYFGHPGTPEALTESRPVAELAG